VRGHQAEEQRHEREQQHDDGTSDPARGVGGAPAERGASRRPAVSNDGEQPGPDEEEAAEHHADAGHVRPRRAGVDDVQAVGDGGEPEREQPEGDAGDDARRPHEVGLGGQPGEWHRHDGQNPERRRVRPEKARSSRWSVTSARPAVRSGRSRRATRSRHPSRRASGGTVAAGRGAATALIRTAALEHVEPRRPPCREDRRHHPGQHRDERERQQRAERDGQRDVVGRQRLSGQRREEDAEREPESRPDQRGDHALVTDHPARLAPGHPDGPQHAELRVRSKTESTSVLTMPNRLTTTEKASST
jgi:hypothetical protein